MVQGYFAAMGGYEVVLEPGSENFFPAAPSGDPREHLRLSPAGLCILAKELPHLIPDLSAAKIWDKSKGDAIAKAIICLQGMGVTSFLFPHYRYLGSYF
jgi:hypothetical protein